MNDSGKGTSGASGDDWEYRLADDDQPTVAPRKDLIKVTCGLCHTLMYARPEHVGKRLRCPDCGSTTKIPPPPPPTPKFQPPDVSDILLDNPPPEVSPAVRQNTDLLMKRAEDELEERDDASPSPWPHDHDPPMLGFLVYPQTLICWLAATAATILVWYLVHQISLLLDSQSIAAVLAVFIVIPTSLMVAAVCGYIGPQLLHVFQFTSDGYDRSPYSPNFDFLERVRAVLFIVNGICLSAAPGLLASRSLAAWRVPWWAGAPLVLVFFPLILLSMLEQSSPWIPYSVHVFRSLGRVAASWVRFYMVTTIVAVVVAFPCVVLLRHIGDSYLARTALVALAWAFALLYFRLAGRLAWNISQDEQESEGLPSEDAVGSAA